MTRKLLHDSASFVSFSVPRTVTPTDLAPRRAIQPKYPVMMHVRLGDVRHRIMLDPKIVSEGRWDPSALNGYGRTACKVTLAGKYFAAINAAYIATDISGVRIALCMDGCFTQGELDLAVELWRKEDERLADKAARDEADRVEANERALYERAQAAERIRRFKTADPTKKPGDDSDD